MRKLGLTLASLCLLSLGACSQAKPEPEIQVVTEVQKAVPPAPLLKQCEATADVELLTTKDLVDSRELWKSAFCKCAAKDDRLIQWAIDKAPDPIPACA